MAWSVQTLHQFSLQTYTQVSEFDLGVDMHIPGTKCEHVVPVSIYLYIPLYTYIYLSFPKLPKVFRLNFELRIKLLSYFVISLNFHSRTAHLDIIKVLLPTDAQEKCFKRSVKIYIKSAPTCFGLITIIRELIIRAC